MKLNLKKMLGLVAPIPLALGGCSTTSEAKQEVNESAVVETAPATAGDGSKPAIWVAKDADTTIYMFGTFHLIKPGTQWFNEAVKDAYDRSDTLVTEIPDPKEDAEAQAMAMKYMTSADGKKLSERLTPDQLTKYKAYLAANNLPFEAFEQFDPWAAGITVTLMQYMKKGITAEAGAEKVIGADAAASKKQHIALETADQQMQWMDSMPMTEQVEGLMSIVEDDGKADELIDKMVVAWNGGKPEGLAELINSEFAKTPATAKALLYDRNARWADWIEKRMETPGTVFMAVGAGHLAGKDSVQDYLAKKNIKSERINY